MHIFKDARGRAWNLEIDCDVIERVKADCGINLLDMADPESGLMKEVATFPPLLAKFLFSALGEQAAALNVNAGEFRRSMKSDAISEGLDALLEEIVLFFPRHRRSLLQAVLEKNKEVEQAGTQMMLDHLANPELASQALAALDRKVQRQIAEALRDLDPLAPSGQTFGDWILGECWTAAGLLRFPTPGPYTWRSLQRLAYGAWRPFSWLIACQTTGGNDPDCYNPYAAAIVKSNPRPRGIACRMDEVGGLLAKIMTPLDEHGNPMKAAS